MDIHSNTLLNVLVLQERIGSKPGLGPVPSVGELFPARKTTAKVMFTQEQNIDDSLDLVSR